MKFKNVILLILITFNCYSQEYHVTAKSGLNIRNKPSLEGDKIGVLTLGETVEIIEDTYKYLVIKSDNKEISGYWVKVKNAHVEGYVFEKYLELVKDHNQNFIKFLKNKVFEDIDKVNGEWVKYSGMCLDTGSFNLTENGIIWFDTNDTFKRRINSVEQSDNKTFLIEFLGGEKSILKIIDSKREIILFDDIYYMPSSKLKYVKTIDIEEDCLD